MHPHRLLPTVDDLVDVGRLLHHFAARHFQHQIALGVDRRLFRAADRQLNRRLFRAGGDDEIVFQVLGIAVIGSASNVDIDSLTCFMINVL